MRSVTSYRLTITKPTESELAVYEHAPELLEAVKQIEAYAIGLGIVAKSKEPQEYLNGLRKLIAKAEGKIERRA